MSPAVERQVPASGSPMDKRAELSVATVSSSRAHADSEAADFGKIERVEPGLITRTETEHLS